mmetsp:Transcript_89235/g.158214  ORF Transcript_89235/g.158214 Transcript_89235/m.158214 type:complete len:1124 (+) Transcript_89235:115-3486(+)|eukprot:CAMPEP_0197644934 /NCGR_PEP_ID=MMETSP1338-20131121/17750_1 /TAXON_ID=43686 ORGANISM="Pelagodinium beii, Strain RCC1491" /NCGR_SAMPLE_ID=MMETSP1338 /ASSEMBLY_ACC=CAM_ASM_000754 /LENGTH=1123 /DNA_ID=CAMNT_0043218417 /DNA_START=24 /DNA_END=3395 /DNA_ORIENTATION=+
MNHQRDQLLEAYKVGHQGQHGGQAPQKGGMHRAASDSQIPVLPALGAAGRGSPNAAVTGIMLPSKSGPLRLPLLPEAPISPVEALALAAAAASESAAAAAQSSAVQKRSNSEKVRPGQKKARANILQLLSLADADEPARQNKEVGRKKKHAASAGEAAIERMWSNADLQRQWDWECRNAPGAKPKLGKDSEEQLMSTSGAYPPKPQRAPPKNKEGNGVQEVNALREISKTAQAISADLTKRRQQMDEQANQSQSKEPPHAEAANGKSGSKALAKAARKKWDSKEKAQSRAAAEAEMEAWRKATLAAVPEAEAEVKHVAESRKKQQDEQRQKEVAAEQAREVSRAAEENNQPGGSEGGKAESEAADKQDDSKNKGPKRSGGSSVNLETVEDDVKYGLPKLQDRLEAVQRTFFGKGEMMDEGQIQRLRVVFNRFRSSSGNEILRTDLTDVAQYIGYVVTSDQELDKITNLVTTHQELDFNEFLEFVEKYARNQFEMYKIMFQVFDFDSSGEIEVPELRKLLTRIGMVVVRGMIQEALDVVDADGNGELNFEEFIRFLTVYNHAEGFTKREVASMWNIYDGFVSETTKLKLGTGLLWKDLSDALVAVFGISSESQAVRLSKRMTTNANGQKRNDDANHGLTFHEFLILSRRLREAELVEYKAEFAKHDEDASGEINAQELSTCLTSLGYKPMRSVINEVLQEVDFESDCELDFEEFYHFLLVFRARDGFTLRELDEFKKVFEKYDEDKSDNVDVHELGDMLRYLGHSIGTDDLYLLVAEVDVNRNGTLDCNEFLRLMRLHRETELKRLQDVFDKHSGGEAMLHRNNIFGAVQDSVGEDTPVKHAKEATSGKTSSDIDFEDFVSLADTAHWSHVVSLRKMAGFSQAEIEQLEEMFSHYDKDSSGDIDSNEVQSLLDDFGLHIRTREERKSVFEQVDQAKKLAQEAGVERDRTKSSAAIMFWELVQLVRLVKTNRAKQKEERHRQITERLRFSKQETDEFRSIFLNWARSGGATPAPTNNLGRRIALNETAAKREEESKDLEDDDAGLPIAIFQKLLRSLGLTITQAHKQVLEQKISSTAETTDAGDLSFVGFLQMMRWMLDDNFAGINGAAQKAASTSQEQYFSKQL